MPIPNKVPAGFPDRQGGSMLTVVAVGLGVCIWFAWMSGGYLKFFNLAMIFFVGLVFGFIFSTLLSLSAPKQWVQTDRYDVPLVSMHDGQGVRGSFFLGCGSFGTQERYVYYYPTPRGGYRQGWVATDLAEVFEEDRTDGVLTVTEYELRITKPFWRWLVIYTPDSSTQYDFHIPKGSLKKDFVLN